MFNIAYYIGVSIIDGVKKILKWFFTALVISLVILIMVLTTLIVTCDKNDKPSEVGNGHIEQIHR